MAKAIKKQTVRKTGSGGALAELMASGAEVPSGAVVMAAMIGDRDVTDADDAQLGSYIKTNVRSGLTCVVYPAGNRVMLSVH